MCYWMHSMLASASEQAGGGPRGVGCDDANTDNTYVFQPINMLILRERWSKGLFETRVALAHGEVTSGRTAYTGERRQPYLSHRHASQTDPTVAILECKFNHTRSWHVASSRAIRAFGSSRR